jgi:hypothetical protein
MEKGQNGALGSNWSPGFTYWSRARFSCHWYRCCLKGTQLPVFSFILLRLAIKESQKSKTEIQKKMETKKRVVHLVSSNDLIQEFS